MNFNDCKKKLPESNTMCVVLVNNGGATYPDIAYPRQTARGTTWFKNETHTPIDGVRYWAEIGKYPDDMDGKKRNALKQCPMCGGDAVQKTAVDSGIYWVECSKCGLSTKQTRNSALLESMWNSRTSEQKDEKKEADKK